MSSNPNYDSELCGKVPLHLINTVQPYGVLLVLDRATLSVIQKIIDWGGDPGERIVYEKDGLNYHPRNSFKQWRQTVTGTSLPWAEDELSIAETLRSFLYEYSNK